MASVYSLWLEELPSMPDLITLITILSTASITRNQFLYKVRSSAGVNGCLSVMHKAEDQFIFAQDLVWVWYQEVML